MDEVSNVIINDSILSEKCKAQLIEYASDKNEHIGLGITFCEALQYVFTRIDQNKARDEIKKILNAEMKDALCMCFTGRISRLVNCLTAIDPLVHIHIVNLNEMFINVGKRLIDINKYSTDDHQKTFEKELQDDYGYEMTTEFQNQLKENFYCEIDYFYETYASVVQVQNYDKSGSTSLSSDVKSSLVGSKRTFKESSFSEANIEDECDDELRKKQKVKQDENKN